MEIILAIVIFGICFLLLSTGLILSKKQLHAGHCGSDVVIKGERMTCGACPSKEAEICASGDKEGFATLAQLGNPTRKKQFKKLPNQN